MAVADTTQPWGLLTKQVTKKETAPELFGETHLAQK
jgi:hypothetical protein